MNQNSKNFAYYSPFVRVKKDKQTVEGIASSEALDSYGDIVRITAIEDALPEYMEFANLRSMHGPIAAGKITDTKIDKSNKVFYITAKVVDKNEWEKVVEEVYKGFSIGGVIEEMKPILVEVKDPDGNTHKVFTGGFEITKIQLIEISLVDRPANPDALFQSYKAANLRKYSTKDGEKELEESFLPNVILKPNLTRFIKETDNTSSPSSIQTVKKSFLSLLAPRSMSKITKADFQKTAKTVVDALLKKHGISQEVLEEPITLSRGEIVDLAREMVSETTDHLAFLVKAEGAEAPNELEADAQTTEEKVEKVDGEEKTEETQTEEEKTETTETQETEKTEEAASTSETEKATTSEEKKVETAQAPAEKSTEKSETTEQKASTDNALLEAIKSLTAVVEKVNKSNEAVAKSVEKSNSEVVSAVNDLKKAAGSSTQSDEEVDGGEESNTFRKGSAFDGDDWGRAL